ncbi:uncharacterized protein LOC127277933 [Leptopilina boulardi]|uniref:uncharacterized protein LOC127277933 n=1 Tax=Leptopilina boulardi TaxID=63433 RepID=UPI0021F57FAC|nr:uncharacterized protein LOC127277933 [Leptopilina boulardi]
MAFVLNALSKKMFYTKNQEEDIVEEGEILEDGEIFEENNSNKSKKNLEKLHHERAIDENNQTNGKKELMPINSQRLDRERRNGADSHNSVEKELMPIVIEWTTPPSGRKGGATASRCDMITQGNTHSVSQINYSCEEDILL